MHPQLLKIEDFNYDLPDEKIAKFPLEQRDASKLLVYKNGSINDKNFSDISNEIKAETLLVFNNSKVVNARLFFKKETGGVIEIFCLAPDSRYSDVTIAMQQKQQVYWQCMVGGAKKWKEGSVITLTINDLKLDAEIAEKTEDGFIILFKWNLPISFAEVLGISGNLPLPPYLNRDEEDEDKKRYQTTYAKHEGSVAAPTAGLHFTDKIFTQLKDKNIQTEQVTLHVGAGTFKPVKADTMHEHVMHYELFNLDIDFLQKIINHTNEIVCVGTTSLRTVESLYWIGVKLLLQNDSPLNLSQWECYSLPQNISRNDALNALIDYLKKNNITKAVAKTQIIIAPGYTLRIANGIVTNFHQPKSTLLLLIAAIIGDNWKAVYKHALGNNYRFLSYGDSSLLMPEL